MSALAAVLCIAAAGGSAAALGARPAVARLSRPDRDRRSVGGTGPGWSTGPIDITAVAAVTTAVAIGARLAGPTGAGLAGVAGVMGVAMRLRSRRRSQREAERGSASAALAVMAAELRAGRTPEEACRAAAEVASGTVAQALRSASAAVRLGGDVPTMLTAAAQRSAAGATLRRLAACWLVSAEAGAGLATTVERLGDGLRVAERHRREVEAQLAGPRASARLLALLPIGGLALGAGLGASPLDVLLHTGVGRVCLVAGLLLEGAGIAWTEQIVRRAATGAR